MLTDLCLSYQSNQHFLQYLFIQLILNLCWFIERFFNCKFFDRFILGFFRRNFKNV